MGKVNVRAVCLEPKVSRVVYCHAPPWSAPLRSSLKVVGKEEYQDNFYLMFFPVVSCLATALPTGSFQAVGEDMKGKSE